MLYSTPSSLEYAGLLPSTEILVRLLQPLKAVCSMEVSDFGMTIPVRSAHNPKAYSPIEVTVSGMETVPVFLAGHIKSVVLSLS